MFENSEFLQWAAENVVFLVGYEGKNHKVHPPKDEPSDAGDGEDGKKKAKKPAHKEGECLLYPGITCDQHEQISKDAKDGTGGPKLTVNGFPTSFLIAPDGTAEKHTKDRAPKDLIEFTADFAKKAKLKPSKKYQTHLDALEEGDKAVEAGKWKAALAAYSKVDAVGKKMPSLAARLPSRVEALEAKVSEAFSKAKDDAATDLAAKVKAVKALRAEVSAKLSTGPLAVVAEMDAWIKENPAPPATPPK